MTSKATDFTQAVRNAAGKRKADALAEYRAIVTRCTSPREGDADKLADLLPVLGLTPGEVEQDIEAVRKLAAMKEAGGKARQRRDAVTETRKALQTFDDESAALQAEQREQWDKRFASRLDIARACDVADTADSEARTAGDVAERVKADHPRLYGDVEAVLNPPPSVTRHETIHVGPREPGPPIGSYHLDMGTGTMIETPAELAEQVA